MKPRSLVFTLFGDYLRYCGDGEAPLSGLGELMAICGVDPATTRTVMSRLRGEGWFTTRRSGRQTSYVLADAGWKLLDDGRSRIFVHRPPPWRGEWTMVLTRTADRTARDEVRRSLAWLGFGQLQPAAWIAPGDRRSAAHKVLSDHVGDAEGDVFLSRVEDLSHDRALASRCWNLEAIADQYRAFTTEHHVPLTGDSDDEVFRRRVHLTSDFRRFPFTDPDLPPELLPQKWVGRDAFALFAKQHERWRSRAEAVVERTVGLPVVSAHRVRIDGEGMDFR